MNKLILSACLALAPVFADAQLMVSPEQSPECIKYFDKGPRTKSNQGMAINGNYLFSFYDGGTCRVFDIRKSGQPHIVEFQLESAQKDNHANQVNFGPVTLKGAAAPLAYVTVGKVGVPIEFTCFVENFKRKGKKWESELVQTITLDTTGFSKKNILKIFGAPSWLVDGKRNEIWILSGLKRTKLKTTGEPYNNKYVALKFRIPDLKEGKNVKFTYKDVLDQRIFNFDAYATQGGCANDGKIYYSFGFGNARNSESPSKIRVFDTDRRVISARYDLGAEIPEECECISIPGDGYMYVNTNSNNVYRIPVKEDITPDIKEDPYTLLRKFPEMIGGTYWIDPITRPEEREAPAGYEPFYMSAYGRHGMRYLDDKTTVPRLQEAFRKADSLGVLTPLGKAVQNRFNMIMPSLDNRTGELTQLGMRQWQNHAKRYVENYPEIFRNNPDIHLESTSVMRTAMSMANFNLKLKELLPGVNPHMDVSVAYHPYLNPYTDGVPYKTEFDESFRNRKGVWYPVWCDFAKSKIDQKDFASRIFTNVGAMEMDDTDLLELEYAFFLLQNDAMSLDMPMLFDDLFTADEMLAWWEIDNLKYFQQKGPWTPNLGRPWKKGALMLDQILESSKEHLENGAENGLYLRLGHDGCIMAILAEMEADKWGVETEDPAKVKDLWQTYLIPMATFFNFNFYRNPNDPNAPILVKVLLNGNAMELPLQAVSDKCYKWDDLYTHYKAKIAKDVKALVDTANVKP